MSTNESNGARDVFRRFAHFVANAAGSQWAFVIAFGVVMVWGVTGPAFRFSDTWQLVINTGTTIVTFLMVFLIQSTQNRDARAVQLKLDELIRSSKARNVFAGLEDATDEELEAFHHEFERIRGRGVRGPDALRQAHAAQRRRSREAKR